MTKEETALLKQALIGLYTNSPKTRDMPVYYVSQRGLTYREVDRLAIAPEEVGGLPLPARKCVILMSGDFINLDDPAETITDITSTFLYVVEEFDEEKLEANHGPVTAYYWIAHCAYGVGDGLLDGPNAFGLGRGNDSDGWRYNVRVESDAKHVRGWAAGLLQALGLMNAPCRYQVAMRDKEGYGPKRGGIKEATRNKPIYRSVPVDRLYKEYASSPGAKSVQRKPHPRRGHIRHLWKQAGIDRHELPADPVERERIARRADVKEVRVKEAWVGPDEFETEDGMTVEVPEQTTEEIVHDELESKEGEYRHATV